MEIECDVVLLCKVGWIFKLFCFNFERFFMTLEIARRPASKSKILLISKENWM